MPIEPVLAPPDRECFDCARATTTNNHVNLYYSVSFGYRAICTRCYNRLYGACNHCEMIHYLSAVDLEGYCPNCQVQCAECDGRYRFLDHGVCSDCGWRCSGCEEIFPDSVASYDNWDDLYCRGCRPELDEDDESRGVRGYGHTHPTMWFGGPLPRDENNKRIGYYLGFELEISADDEDARPIHNWAQDNGLGGFFDCKQDSSVEGYEIATQPFTPKFFETLMEDGRMEAFFQVVNSHHPLPRRQESTSHGLHVHIGRVAFERDDVALAAFSYLLGQDQGKHLERIARRDPTGYCTRVEKPVSTAIVSRKENRQKQRIYAMNGVYPSRSAINLTNGNTVEIRAFRSTRSAEELAAAVRLVYVAAEYVRYLRSGGRTRGIDPKALAWSEFCRWVAFAHPVAFASLANLESDKKVQPSAKRADVVPAGASVVDFMPEVQVTQGRGSFRAVDLEPIPVRAGATNRQVVDYRLRMGTCFDTDCCPITDDERRLVAEEALTTVRMPSMTLAFEDF